MSTVGSKALIGTLVAVGLAHPMPETVGSPQGDAIATFVSRVETLQKSLAAAPPASAENTQVAQFRDLPWTNFSQWAQCGSDVKC
jgi:hypothetical protein